MKGDSLVLAEAMKRMRELEAELDVRTGEAKGLAEAASRQKARAEKAEKALAGMDKPWSAAIEPREREAE